MGNRNAVESNANVMRSRSFRLRAAGPLACFTRPEMKAERVSYEVMTPAAARGIFEAIFWKPAIHWRMQEIAVLKPVAWLSLRRNELGSVQRRGGTCFIEDDRMQRHTLALKDVEYVITASFVLTARSKTPQADLSKYEAMFERRLEKGQHFQMPYLGCREFAAAVTPAETNFQPHEKGVDRSLGPMFYDFDFAEANPRPHYFEAHLRDGILHVPLWDEVMSRHPRSDP